MKHTSHQAHGLWRMVFSRRTITILAASALAWVSAVTVQGTEGPKTKVVVANLCELSSAKAVTYKLAAGPWLSKQGGSVMATLPLEVRTGENPCQIKIEKQAVLQVQAASEMQLRREGKGLLLTIRKGGCYYGLSQGVTLKVATAGGTVVAQAGGAAAAKNSSAFASMGLVRALPGSVPSLDLANIQGQASVMQAGASDKEIPVGQKLRYDNGATLIVAQSAEPVTRPMPVGEAATAAPAAVAAPAMNAPAARPVAVAAPMSATAVEKVLRSSLPGAVNDNLSQIATPVHSAGSPYIPPPRNRVPLPAYLLP